MKKTTFIFLLLSLLTGLHAQDDILEKYMQKDREPLTLNQQIEYDIIMYQTKADEAKSRARLNGIISLTSFVITASDADGFTRFVFAITGLSTGLSSLIQYARYQINKRRKNKMINVKNRLDQVTGYKIELGTTSNGIGLLVSF